MKSYSELEQKIEQLKEENLLAKSILSLYKDKIDALLLMMESVNKNFNASVILSLFENNIKNLMKVKNYTLIVKSDKWHIMLNEGIKFDLEDINIDEELRHLTKVKSAKPLKNSKFQQFEYVIPVLHKNEYLALLFLEDVRIMQIDITKEEKLRFIETFLNITIISLENKKLYNKIKLEGTNEDLILAAEVQAELIPSVFPRSKHFEFYGKYIPYDTVGGDYYDFIQLDEENIAFCICDVAGKGISAGMLMSNFQASLRTLLSRDYELLDLVKTMNEKFINVTKQNRYITMFIAKYNIKTRTLEYINAGHNSPVLKNGNETLFLSKGCTILGMIEDLIDIESETIILEKEAVLVMYTDGFSEIQNKEDAEFGINNIANFVNQNFSLSVKDLTHGLIDEVEVFKGNNEIFDDVSLLCAKF